MADDIKNPAEEIVTAPRKKLHIDKILLSAVKNNASDIHFKVGKPPLFRIHGNFRACETQSLDPTGMREIINTLVVDDARRITLYEQKNLDLAIEITDLHHKTGTPKTHRYRVNIAHDHDGLYAVLRVIPDTIRSITDLGFPTRAWKDIIQMHRGMVLVTGITGSGKTTTLASLLQEINNTRGERIITLEDPIEYIHPPKKSIISQRELGVNVHSYADGVKYALRQDPDVILIGEIRDRETGLRALEAAATGHLVFSTLHTKNAPETVQRYVNLFDAADHENIKDSLSANLAYVISQQLIPYQKDFNGRTLAMEIMNVHASPGIQKYLRDGTYHKITSDMQTGRKHQMITMDQHLVELVRQEKLTEEHAIQYAHNKQDVQGQL